MSTRENVDRMFETMTERREATFDAIKAANERYHRFARSVIEATRQGSHDWTNVARGWARRPTDAVGLYESATEAMANDQTRRLALGQELLEDLAESQREGREMMRRRFGEVRQAMERVQETVPSFLRRPRARAGGREEAEPIAKA